MIKTLAYKQFGIKQHIKRHAVGFYYLHFGVKIGVKYKICQARDWCQFSARNNTRNTQPRPQGQLLYDFQNGGSFGECPGKG